MRVYTFDKNRVNIYLNPQEVDDIFGGYEYIDYDMPDCRVKIHGIIAATLPPSLLPLDCERILIEVKPVNTGCTITLTKIYKCATNKNTEKTAALIFQNSESLICSLSELKKINHTESILYSKNYKYAIILTGKDIYTRNLSDYCEITENLSAAEKIREYWQKICDNGINTLSSAFLK